MSVLKKFKQNIDDSYTKISTTAAENGAAAEEVEIPYHTITEALTTRDANIFFPKTIERVLVEAAEPQYFATNFFRKVTLESGKSMEFVNFSAIRASEIPEGAEYPEDYLDLARFGGKQTLDIKVKKYGLKVNVTEEVIKDSQWDVLGMHIEAAGRALARKKEEVCFLEMSRNGHVVFDTKLGGTFDEHGHYIPNDSGFAPSGRGYDGYLNGTITTQDFLDMVTSIMSAGLVPTDVIMHPLCYSLFVANKNLMGLLTLSPFGSGENGTAQAPAIPMPGNYSVPGGLNLSFSPYVPFDPENKVFDMYIIDRNNVGIMVVKDEMSTEQFADPLRDIQTLKVRERYGVGILFGGLGVAVAKNIKFAKTYEAPDRTFEKMARPTDMDKMDEVHDFNI